MNNKITIITMVLFLLNCTIVFSQEDGSTRHQISINASKFIPLFNEQINNLDLTYRWAFGNRLQNLRAAASIDLGTAENELNDFSVRLGIDRTFKKSGRWTFYYGLDATYGKTVVKSTQRISTKMGLLPFAGFLYQIGPHFSLSTEPSLALFRNEAIDQDSFNPNASNINYTLNFINIGQVKIGFHF